MRGPSALAVAATLLLVASGHAAQEQSSSFRTSVDLVQVDVSVLDGNRRPVEGLTAADFTVREDGKPRAVTAFSAVELESRQPLAGAAPWTRDIAPDVITNAVPREGRLVVILFDRTIRNADRQVATATAEAVVDQLGPADLAAVIYTMRGTPQNFTGDRRLLHTAIARPFMGLADNDRGNPGECRCGVCTLETIANVADALRDVPQRRKMLVYLGSRIPVQSQGPCGGLIDSARRKVFRATDVANLAIYTIDSNGLEAPGGAAAEAGTPNRNAAAAQLQRQGDLAVYPDHTGGRAVLNTNTPAELVPAIFAESRSYYVLGFPPGSTNRDGKFHDVKVTVNRPGVTVHSRLGYYAPSNPPRDMKGTKDGPPATLVAALAGLWPKTGIPLSVTVAPFALTGRPEGLVAIVTHVSEPLTVNGAPAPGAIGPQRITVLAGAYDRNGKPVDSHVQTIEVAPRPGAQSTLEYEVISKLTLKPGHHEIRVAAENQSRGTSGSVYTYADVPDFSRAGVLLSGIVLAADSGRGKKNAVLGDLLPLTPGAVRTFAPGAQVTALVRVYQSGTGGSGPVTVTARILDAGNQQVFQQRVPLFDAQTPMPRSADYEVALPLSQLTAGEYLLTIQVGNQRPAAGRDVRFTVR